MVDDISTADRNPESTTSQLHTPPRSAGPMPGFQGSPTWLPSLRFTYDLLIPKMILHLYPKANVTKASIQK